MKRSSIRTKGFAFIVNWGMKFFQYNFELSTIHTVVVLINLKIDVCVQIDSIWQVLVTSLLSALTVTR